MDMKISKRDAALLIGLAGILMIVAVYYFVYIPLDEKKIALESENATLQTRVTELQRMYDEKDTYIAQTESMKAEIDTICNSFPADVKTEDMIMLGVDLANTAPLSVQSISMGVAEDMYHVGQAVAEAAAAEAAAAAAATATEDGTTAPAPVPEPVEPSADKVLYKKLCGITYQVTYDGFKNAINTICSSVDRRTIDSITATYDINTGLLAATQNINMYYMTGTDKEYVAPTIPFIPQGTDNIFGTIDLVVTEDEEADTQE